MVLVVQAYSAGFDAGNFALISLNGFPVPMEKNEHKHDRGLHIVVINNKTGKIETAEIFDTYKTCQKFDNFVT